MLLWPGLPTGPRYPTEGLPAVAPTGRPPVGLMAWSGDHATRAISPTCVRGNDPQTQARNAMIKRHWLVGLLVPAGLSLTLATLPASEDKPVPASAISWKKTLIDKVFRSEGVAVADVNKDGKMDILNGEAWYEAPDWKMHEITKLGAYGNGL